MEMEAAEETDLNSQPDVTRWELSPEILAQIFSHLSVQDKGRVALVCVAWKNAAYLPSVWQTVEVKLRSRAETDEHLIASLAERRVTNITVFNLGANYLRDVIEGVESITEISFESCRDLTQEMMFGAFINGRPHLTSLNCNNFDAITDITMSLFAANFKSLTSLHLFKCDELTDRSLLFISLGLRNLKVLCLWNCNNISDAGIGHLACVDRKEALSRLQLKSFSVCFQNMTDVTLCHIGMTQNRLTVLELRPGKNISDFGMSHLAKMGQLKHLTLYDSYATADCLAHLYTGNWRVSVLKLLGDSVGSEGMANIARLPDLRCLVLKSCNKLYNDSMSILAELGTRVTKMTIDSCKNLQDDGLKHLARFPQLQKLKLLNCSSLSNLGLDNLVEGGSKITVLSVIGCPKIGPTALRIIASGLYQLRYLRLESGHISDQGLRLAAVTLTDLISLLADGKELISEVRRIRLTFR